MLAVLGVQSQSATSSHPYTQTSPGSHRRSGKRQRGTNDSQEAQRLPGGQSPSEPRVAMVVSCCSFPRLYINNSLSL
jgi:hypothetical protein